MGKDTTRRLLACATSAVLSLVLAGPASAADGDLDVAFGTGGLTFVDVLAGDEDDALAVALDRSGRTVLAGGNRTDGRRRFQLARLDAAGGLDTSFGTGGRVVTQLGHGGPARAVGVQADGTIGAPGAAGNLSHEDPHLALARYDED